MMILHEAKAKNLSNKEFSVTQIVSSLIANEICKFFRNYLSMQVRCKSLQTSSYSDYTLTTEVDNPFVKPKNLKPVLTSAANKTMFLISPQDFNDQKLSDVKIFVEGKEINAHKFILSSTCPSFKKAFEGRWKDKSEIIFKECKYETFLEFNRFIYTGEVDTHYINDFENCMELLQLADRLGNETLPYYIKKELQITGENFIHIALVAAQLNDLYLLDLCKWFAKNDPIFGEELELTSFPMENLETLKEKPELLESLRAGKDEKYKDLWIAFQELCTTIEI